MSDWKGFFEKYEYMVCSNEEERYQAFAARMRDELPKECGCKTEGNLITVCRKHLEEIYPTTPTNEE